MEMNKKYKVLLADTVILTAVPDEAKKRYPDTVDQIEFIMTDKGDEAELMEKVTEADIIMGFRLPISGKVIDKGESLFFIQQCSDGYDNIDLEAAKKKGVKVSNAGGAGVIPVSEHAVMLMLSLSKRLIKGHQGTIAGEWPQLQLAGSVNELHGKTLGIVGLGKIGAQTARLGNVFGMKLQYYDPYRKDTSDLEFPIKSMTLEELLKTSDFISVHAISTEDTKHLIGKKELEMMKPTAYLINTSRGMLVDEEALIEVLEKGGIKGAGLDVYGTHAEAVDKSSKLLTRDDVVLTPHVAGATAENISRVFFEVSLGNVVDVVNGKPPKNVVT